MQAAVSENEEKHNALGTGLSSGSGSAVAAVTPPPGLGSGSSSSLKQEDNLPKYHLNQNQTKSLPSKPIGPLGTLKILPPSLVFLYICIFLCFFALLL